MSKSTNPKKAGNEGKWTLSYAANRSDRLQQLQEFIDDCEKQHQRFAGSEIGPYLKRRTLPAMPVGNQPTVPVQATYQLPNNGGDDVAAYRTAVDTYEKDKSLWFLKCKNAESFIHECTKTYLPKLFVYLQGRCDANLRVRLEQHASWDAIEQANPRSPLALLDLIREVLQKGEISDVGYEKYETLKDLFSPGMAMKQGHSLSDYEKVVRDRMRFIQGKDYWKKDVTDANGVVSRISIFDEEFFVNLMFDNLTKPFQSAKIDYTNDIASTAVIRKKTFGDFVDYFSQIRTHSGQHVATALVTNKKKSRGKGSGQKDKTSDKSENNYKADGSNDPRRTRNCSKCDGAHWDNHCSTSKKSKNGGDKKSNAPTSQEVKAAKELVKKETASKLSSDTLVTFGDVKMGDLTYEQIQEYCAFVEKSQESI
jgi:hypothetical protein